MHSTCLSPFSTCLPGCLQKFDSSFNYVSQFGSSGTGNGQVRGTLAVHATRQGV